MLEKVPDSISDLLSKSLDKTMESEIRDVEQKLTHMPPLLTLICRLFSREFQQQYATIREKINTHFRRWMDHDLCLYRPDLVESLSSSPNK